MGFDYEPIYSYIWKQNPDIGDYTWILFSHLHNILDTAFLFKNIYNAPSKEAAAMELDNLEKKWGGKYPYAILSWRRNWDDLTVFFQFPLEIRNIIYTTNLIENLNGKIRKYTKSKLSFPSDDAVKKTVYLSLMEIEKKWTQPIHNWGLIMNQFILIFENRIQI